MDLERLERNSLGARGGRAACLGRRSSGCRPGLRGLSRAHVARRQGGLRSGAESGLDAAALRLAQNERVVLKNEIGCFEGRIFLAPMARGNLQIHWPEGNAIIRRGVVDPAGGVPDYNARVKIEKFAS